MKSAEKYALRFSKAMKTLGSGGHKKLGAAFLRRYSAYLDSEEYKTFRDKYPSIGADKVYIGITFAEIMTKIGYTLDEALRVWEDVFMADKKRKINRLIRLIDTLGLGYKVASNRLDKDKQETTTALSFMRITVSAPVSLNTRYTPARMSICLNGTVSANSARRSVTTTCVCAPCGKAQDSSDIPILPTEIAVMIS